MFVIFLAWTGFAFSAGNFLVSFPPVVRAKASDQVFAENCATTFYERAKVSQSFDSTVHLADRRLGDSLAKCQDSILCIGRIASGHGGNIAIFTKVERIGSRILVHYSWLDFNEGKFLGAATLEGTNTSEISRQTPALAEVAVSKAVGIWPYNLNPPSAGFSFPPSESVGGGTLVRSFFLRNGDTTSSKRTFGFSHFRMAKTETTWRQYQACVAAGACRPAHYRDATCSTVWEDGSWLPRTVPEPDAGSDLPVTCVDWIQARDFCAWVGGDLPTQMQWEFAARAGDPGDRPWSSTDEVCRSANVRDKSFIQDRPGWDAAFECQDGYPGAAPAGRFPPNKFGLHDMIGNVREWVRDVSNPWFFSKADSLDPRFEPVTNSWRYQMGTSFSSPRPSSTAYSYREVGWAGSASTAVGFRCVQTGIGNKP